MGRAVRELRSIEEYDDNAKSLVTELEQIDGLLNDFNRNIAEYLSDMEFDGEVFAQTQERLNLLNHLKLKYGGTIEAVLEYQQQAQRIEKLQNMDAYREQLVHKLPGRRKSLRDCAVRYLLSDRKKQRSLQEIW